MQLRITSYNVCYTKLLRFIDSRGGGGGRSRLSRGDEGGKGAKRLHDRTGILLRADQDAVLPLDGDGDFNRVEGVETEGGVGSDEGGVGVGLGGVV